MQYLEKHLFVKRSIIPGAGKGLFTKQFISKGTRIVEYRGRITTWKDVLRDKQFNGYVYYVNPNYVIDAITYKKALARYMNDAAGLTKIKGLSNNSIYINEKGKVFIDAVKNISAGEEIYVSYGKDYWNVIRYNNKLPLNKDNARKKT